MERERRRKMLDRMLKKCPDRMKPTEVPQWFPLGKNTVYQLIADGKLRSHRMTYGYVILKEDFMPNGSAKQNPPSSSCFPKKTTASILWYR